MLKRFNERYFSTRKIHSICCNITKKKEKKKKHLPCECYLVKLIAPKYRWHLIWFFFFSWSHNAIWPNLHCYIQRQAHQQRNVEQISISEACMWKRNIDLKIGNTVIKKSTFKAESLNPNHSLWKLMWKKSYTKIWEAIDIVACHSGVEINEEQTKQINGFLHH